MGIQPGMVNQFGMSMQPGMGMVSLLALYACCVQAASYRRHKGLGMFPQMGAGQGMAPYSTVSSLSPFSFLCSHGFSSRCHRDRGL
jgi:hypothetical protein